MEANGLQRVRIWVDVEESTGQVVALELRFAFHDPGCPVCRVRQQSVHRYLFGLLWEDVNNVRTRIELASSHGFCPEHTWQLYHLANARFYGEAGIAIVYEDLARYLADRLRHAGSCAPNATRKPRWWQYGWRRLRAALGLHRSASVRPERSCPACERGDTCEARNLEWLVEGCLDPAFRKLYEASDGLCLPHLCQALAMAKDTHPRAIPVLACATAQRLEGLAGDLGEYVRKHAWEYRHERVTEEEQISVHRMSQLVGGLDRYALELGRSEPASQGLTRDRLKQMGLRIDE